MLPSTEPFSATIINRIKSRTQATRWATILREVREFRAYCCDIDSVSIEGIEKEPVIFLDISANPVCAGQSISWDISNSYAPGSTLTGWEVDFGDDTAPAGGSDFPNDTTSGSHTYDEVGTYLLEATIVEGLGKDQTSKVEITVVDCTEAPTLPNLWSYASTDGQGVLFIDWSQETPAWENRNVGLSTDALNVRSLVIDPRTRHLNPESHILWAATQDGVYKTINGGNEWSKIEFPDPSNDEFNDDTPVLVGELDWNKVVLNGDDVYVLASYIEAE